MRWQSGDAVIQVGGKEVLLRLTMGALAELDARLGVSGPEELAEKFRNLKQVDARQILACLVTDRAAIGDVLIMPDEALRGVLPVMCRLFEEAFS